MKFKTSYKYKYILILVIFFIFIILICSTYYNTFYIENMDQPSSDTVGFIVTRHTKCENTNITWIKCVQQIRKFYPDVKIVIIDDNSNYEFIKYDESVLTNCIVIDSEYKGSGELLSYYYFYHNKWFDKAIYIHDSVFINTTINTNNINNVKFLWDFNSYQICDSTRTEELLSKLNYGEQLISLYRSNEWKGCFGAMSVINHVYLKYLVDKYKIFVLLDHINSRGDRMVFERLFGIICCLENYDMSNPSIFGYYGDNCNSRNDLLYTYNDYIEDETNGNITTKISKIFFGR